MELIHTFIIDEVTFRPKTIALVINDKLELCCYKLDINQNMIEDLKFHLNVEINLLDYINEWTSKYPIETLLKTENGIHAYNKAIAILRDKKIDNILDDGI